MPTGLGELPLLRSSAAHWDWGWQLRSSSAHCDEELARRRGGEEEKKKRKEEQARRAILKSNNPHLAGGEEWPEMA